MMYSVIRALLFKIDPEKAHHFSFGAIRLFEILGLTRIIRSLWVPRHSTLRKEVMGIAFDGPVGLAAGFDKNALLYNAFSDFGFGFVEIGTVTPKAQPGNPKKRLFRLKEDRALINRMGFNNDGVDRVVARLSKSHRTVVGGNIGKNKVTPNENAIDDYTQAMKALYGKVDYFVVNVSSPNTPGLRELQEKEPLFHLLKTLLELRDQLADGQDTQPCPLLLKIAPDLSDAQLDDILDIVETLKLDGVIATNTTLSREGLNSDASLIAETGGLSGAPLTQRSTEVIRYLKSRQKHPFAIIGVGGIDSAAAALEKLDAGADLIQLYTGFVYKGPQLIWDIHKALIERAHGQSS
jgi:dihydroorotate dehydrogenase